MVFADAIGREPTRGGRALMRRRHQLPARGGRELARVSGSCRASSSCSNSLTTTASCSGLTTGNVEEAAHIKLARADLNRFFAFGGYGSDSATDRAHQARAERAETARRRRARPRPASPSSATPRATSPPATAPGSGWWASQRASSRRGAEGGRRRRGDRLVLRGPAATRRLALHVLVEQLGVPPALMGWTAAARPCR